MTCLNCDADNTRDYPVCPTCEITRHFDTRADCRCEECQPARIEFGDQFEYGWTVQTSALMEVA